MNTLLKVLRVSCMSLAAIYFYYFFEVGSYFTSEPGDGNFHYPLDIDVKEAVQKLITGEKMYNTINEYNHEFNTNSLLVCKNNTQTQYDLVILVQSPAHHFQNRNAVRETYGKENQIEDLSIKTVFFIGTVSHSTDKKIQDEAEILKNKVALESRHFQDVVQINLEDGESTATNKTMTVLRWAFQYCGNANYYLFTEDDMYVSLPNLLDFVRGENYATNSSADNDSILYAGQVGSMIDANSLLTPIANFSSGTKTWPPFVTNGAYILSNKALHLLYNGSFYVKHFVYDDIFLGIVAYRMKMNLTHIEGIQTDKIRRGYYDYESIIACRGFKNQEELVTIWRRHNQIY